MFFLPLLEKVVEQDTHLDIVVPTRLYGRGTRAKAASFWASEVPCEAGLSAELGQRVLAAQ